MINDECDEYLHNSVRPKDCKYWPPYKIRYNCECGAWTNGYFSEIWEQEQWIECVVCRECGAILDIFPVTRPTSETVLQSLPDHLREKVRILDRISQKRA